MTKFSPPLVRERLMQEYFRRDFWQEKQSNELNEQWHHVVATLEQVNYAESHNIESWLRDICHGCWAWKAVVATCETVQITFFFEHASDAVLFKLTFI